MDAVGPLAVPGPQPDAGEPGTDDPVEQYGILSCCAHVFPDERIAHLRSIYNQRGEIDDVLREMYTDPAWYEDPVRKGNLLYMRKDPYDPEGYKAHAGGGWTPL